VVLAAVLVVALDWDSRMGNSATPTSAGTNSSVPPAEAITGTTTAAVSVTSIEATPTTGDSPATVTSVPSTDATETRARHEESDPRLIYAGSWSTRADESASGAGVRLANSAGASVTVNFEGTYLAWIAERSPLNGVAEVTLDGKDLGTIDLYSADTGAGSQQKVWGTGTLKPGLHAVTITWTGAKNAAATDTSISVDAFEVLGSLVEVP
jgi:hypothetical protein